MANEETVGDVMSTLTRKETKDVNEICTLMIVLKRTLTPKQFKAVMYCVNEVVTGA